MMGAVRDAACRLLDCWELFCEAHEAAAQAVALAFICAVCYGGFALAGCVDDLVLAGVL